MVTLHEISDCDVNIAKSHKNAVGVRTQSQAPGKQTENMTFTGTKETVACDT